MSCLNSISVQTKLPKEVLVIDNAKDIETENLIKARKNEFKEKNIILEYIRNERENSLSIAENIGIENATGNIILILDMGGSPEEFIRKLLEDYQFSMFVIGSDYSMHDYASSKDYLKINSVDEVMNLCKSENDHINLFLRKGEDKDDGRLFQILSENSTK